MTGLLLLFGLLALAILAAVVTAIALLWIWGRRRREPEPAPDLNFKTYGYRIPPAVEEFLGLPVRVDPRMPEDEIEMVSGSDRVRVVNLDPSAPLANPAAPDLASAFNWPNPAPAAYDWQRDRAWSERRV